MVWCHMQTLKVWFGVWGLKKDAALYIRSLLKWLAFLKLKEVGKDLDHDLTEISEEKN